MSNSSKKYKTSWRKWLWLLWSFGIWSAMWRITLSITSKSTIRTDWYNLRRTRQGRELRTWYLGHWHFTSQPIQEIHQTTSRWPLPIFPQYTKGTGSMKTIQMKGFEESLYINLYRFIFFTFIFIIWRFLIPII